MTKALIIVAHGSRLASSNTEVEELASRVRSATLKDFSRVRVAFLEFTEPGISTAIDRCCKEGADKIIVLPYFLAAGRHVLEDVPRELEMARATWPNRAFQLLPHIGSLPAITDLLIHATHNEQEILAE